MGSSTSKENNTNYIDKINEINIDDLDLSKIDNLQLKAIKELGNKTKEIEKKKAIGLCINYQRLIFALQV